MMTTYAATLFSSTSSVLYFVLLVLAALILGLYLWGNAHKQKQDRADFLQEKYASLDRPTLVALPEQELVNAVIANLLAKLEKHNPDDYKHIPLLSRGRRAVYSVWLTCHTVEEDGLQVYLHSPSGRFAELAADGLELLGANSCAAILREVRDIDTFDEERLLLQQEKLLAGIHQEDPLKLCAEYIRINPEDFIDVPSSDNQGPNFDSFSE